MAIDNKIIIFSEQTSPRLEYVLDLICKDLWGLQWELTHDLEFFNQSAVGVINYSHQISRKGVTINPCSLLFEKEIKNQEIKVSFKDQFPLFYNNDFFAMIFFMVSRYEEYLPFVADNHGRFSGSQSLAFRHDFLEKPVVHLWANHLKKLIQKEFPFIKFGQNKFSIQPTYDIDIAWAFKNKGFKRQLGGMLKSLVGNGVSLTKRWKILFGKEKDPFDTFDYLDTVNSQYHVPVKYFILIGDYGPFDKNTFYQNRNFRQLLKRLHKKYQLGIHPSYLSNDSFEQLLVEKERLENIIQESVTRSRQHYLKLQFPNTYQRLIKAGIQEDYSMGYQDAVGFRAGMSIPFYWYDLSKEKVTDLKIFPFQLMDVTLQQYLGLSVDDAMNKVQKISDEIKTVGGTLTYLWHNSSFYDEEGWKDWDRVLESI